MAEKALKGLVLGLAGDLKVAWHKLEERINLLPPDIQQEVRDGLAKEDVEIQELEDYYLRTRYPNQWPGEDDIPANLYSTNQAKKALLDAKCVLQLATSKMPDRALFARMFYHIYGFTK